MHSKMIEDASLEQLKSFLRDQFDELKHSMPELYKDMECELYEHIYGEHFNQWKYEAAVAALENRDGSKGPHWSASDITNYAKSHGASYRGYNDYDFAYAMNMVYSDYYGIVNDTVDTYYRLALAFIEDKDAPEGKAFRYWKAMRD